MTLVISALTQDCVWQVVDRRLTDVATGRPVSVDTNKAIYFAQAMLFAYTGPARIEGTDTAQWIADELWKGENPEEGLMSLDAGLRRAFGHVRHPALRSFAVDGVGWALDRLTGGVGPRLLRFSNCLNDDGVWTGSRGDEIRRWDGLLKPGAGLNMRAAGQPVPLDIGLRWERQIRRRVASGAPPSDVGRCLVQFVRDVGARNPAVGKGVLLSAIPRRAVTPQTGFTIASVPMAHHATFKYFPEGSDEGVDKGPEVANPGRARISDFWAQTDGRGNQTVRVNVRIPARRS